MHDFRKKNTELIKCILISTKNISIIFLILRRIRHDRFQMCVELGTMYHLIFSDHNETGFLTKYLKK